MAKKEFLSDIRKIREDARKNLMRGAITENYQLDINQVLDILNSALATELICVLRYKKHHYTASSLGASVAAAEFLQHANEEQEHANQLSQRIVQLGGEPNLSPFGLPERAHADYVECNDIKEMIKENLIAERIAIDSYRDMILFIGDHDTTTKSMLETILATEEEHADDLLDMAAEYHICLEES